NPGAWPSMIVIHSRKFEQGRLPFCGGTIIDSEWVLTASHCTAKQDAHDLFIREAVNSATSGGHSIDVREIVMHPSYSTNPPLNDVPLLPLAAPARSPHQLLMSNAREGELVRDGTMATIIGYGRVKAQPLPGEQPPNFDAGPTSEK